VKCLSHLEDRGHTDIDQQHFLDLLKVSNNVLLISNLVKFLSHLEERGSSEEHKSDLHEHRSVSN
jgi:hypothetical protein